MDKIEVGIKIGKNIHKTYTVYAEEIEQLACNKAREDYPEAGRITAQYANISVSLKEKR